MGALGFLSRAWRLVSSLLGRSFRDWSEWAVREPAAAAHELGLLAAMLEGRSRAYRNPDGWRGRRDREIAASLRKHARALMATKTRDELVTACAIRPGTMPVEESQTTKGLP